MPLPIVIGAGIGTKKFVFPIAGKVFGSIGGKVFGGIKGLFGGGRKKRAGEDQCVPCNLADPRIEKLFFLFQKDSRSLDEARTFMFRENDKRCNPLLSTTEGVVQGLIFRAQGGGDCKLDKKGKELKVLDFVTEVLLPRAEKLLSAPPRIPNPKIPLGRATQAAEDFISRTTGTGTKTALIGGGVLIAGIVIFLIVKSR